MSVFVRSDSFSRRAISMLSAMARALGGFKDRKDFDLAH
jgi:hypothetical protein